MVDESQVSLPTEAEIATLPRWARIALATRCAQRAHISEIGDLVKVGKLDKVQPPCFKLRLFLESDPVIVRGS